MRYIISYRAANHPYPRYVFDRMGRGTHDRLLAMEYKSEASAKRAANRLRSLGFTAVAVESRTTLAQETAKPKPEPCPHCVKPEPDAGSPLNQHARKRLAELMEGKGWTAKDVPGFRQFYVLDVLAGRKKMSRDMMERFAAALGLDVLTFFGIRTEAD